MKLESLALHHGYESEATTKAAAVPIYQTTSYTFDDTQHGADFFFICFGVGFVIDAARHQIAAIHNQGLDGIFDQNTEFDGIKK